MNADSLDETDHLFPARRGQPLRSLAHGPVTEHFALPVAITARAAATTTASAPAPVPPPAGSAAMVGSSVPMLDGLSNWAERQDPQAEQRNLPHTSGNGVSAA